MIGLPRTLKADEKSVVLPHYRTALEIAKQSDCSEAQFGAVIFRGVKVLARGINHVPEHLNGIGWACKSHCPRFGVPQLRNGVGAELCFVIHAEQDAVNNLAKLPVNIRKVDEPRSSMVVARLKNMEEVVPIGSRSVRCTECSKKIANETKIRDIVFPLRIGEGLEFIAYGKVEFHTESSKNLFERWSPVLDSLARDFG